MKLASILIIITLFVHPAKARAKHQCSMGNDCGCVNWKQCSTPCSGCCGPDGMYDCFKNPKPEKD